MDNQNTKINVLEPFVNFGKKYVDYLLLEFSEAETYDNSYFVHYMSVVKFFNKECKPLLEKLKIFIRSKVCIDSLDSEEIPFLDFYKPQRGVVCPEGGTIFCSNIKCDINTIYCTVDISNIGFHAQAFQDLNFPQQYYAKYRGKMYHRGLQDSVRYHSCKVLLDDKASNKAQLTINIVSSNLDYDLIFIYIDMIKPRSMDLYKNVFFYKQSAGLECKPISYFRAPFCIDRSVQENQDIEDYDKFDANVLLSAK